MVIVEGPDGAGKTTLVKHLHDELGLPVAGKVVDAKTNPLTDLKRWVEENLEAGCRPVLFDRHRLISEPIYGSALRPAFPSPGFDNVHWLTDRLRQLQKLDPCMIFCLPPIETVRNNIRGNNDQPLYVRQRINLIYRMYFFEAARWPHAALYNYHDEHSGIGNVSKHFVTREVERWMKNHRFLSSEAG